MIEWIVENEKDARAAEKLGADRLELVSAIELGGLTPSYGTIKKTISSIQIPVQVMVRPHAHGFTYDRHDKEAILEDIAILSELGHHRIVIGALDESKKIDTNLLDRVIEQFPGLNVTFHRAFDEAVDLEEAYRTLTTYKSNIKRVLTSGGAASCFKGRKTLQKLVKLQDELNGPIIMPGGGLKLGNVREIHEAVQANEYHFGSGVRRDQSFEKGFEKETIDNIKSILT